MWQFRHTATTTAKIESIWALYSDIATWVLWDKGMEAASLEGLFVRGTRGFLQPEGQERLPFALTEVEPMRGFSDLTEMTEAGLQIRFRHLLARTADGKTSVTHEVTIDGPNADTLGPQIGAGMSEGIPETVAGLIALALEREREASA